MAMTAYNPIEECPLERMKRSRSGQPGSAGRTRSTRKKSATSMSMADSGPPTCPPPLPRDPRIALAVLDLDPEAELYVTVQAEAVVAATGDRAVRDIQDLARRYGSDPSSFEGLERIRFRLVPRSVTVHGDLD